MKELSSRPRRIILELMELFASMLRPEAPVLLDRLQAELARSTGPAAANGSRDCCLESVKALRLRREEFVPALLEALQRECTGLLDSARQPRIAAATVPAVAMSLELLEDEETDEEGTLAAIASRQAHRASLPLLLLGQRFGVLLGSPALAAGQLPVGPRALGDALAVAAHRIGLCVHARMSLYRLHDMQSTNRYPGFAEAMDASVDRAGVLPGLAFVPLRPNPAATHEGRGRVAENAGLPAAEGRAAQAVNEALETLRQAGRLPESMAEQRNMTISAMGRFLLRHGQDSSEWQECVRCARAVLEAVRLGQPPPLEARAWIENALGSVGYSAEDARKLASALTSIAVLREPVVRKADAMRGPREQRCLDRLVALPLGTRLGFSTAGGGFMRSRLRYHYEGPGLLLLANEADGQEALFEIDAVARQMAAGQAWVIHRSATGATGAGAARDQEREEGPWRQWPEHVRGRELS